MFGSSYMIKINSVLFLFLFWGGNILCQNSFLEGSWQGILTDFNQPYKKGKAIWFDFKIDPSSGSLTGSSRTETPFTEYFAYKTIRGDSKSKNVLEFEEFMIGKQKNTGANVWCMNEGKLSYNDSTGYLSGEWQSTDCNRKSGKIILYRSKYEMSHTDTLTMYHSWFNNMVNDLNRGWNAYYVRDEEMKNFEFVPVYFDHDKDVLKIEFEDYLNRMAKIINSHSDLRVKIIGHTDSNGTDEYNVDLSARRASRIEAFLKGVGVHPDKIVIEFRGERDPATSNKTADGKRLNRRVDFEFI